MSEIKHHAIVVTGIIYPSQVDIQTAHHKAIDLFDHVSGLIPSYRNGYYSFLIPPDGSYEHWDESNDYDQRRQAYIEWLISKNFGDGSNILKWVEVQYGCDDNENRIING